MERLPSSYLENGYVKPPHGFYIIKVGKFCIAIVKKCIARATSVQLLKRYRFLNILCSLNIAYAPQIRSAYLDKYPYTKGYRIRLPLVSGAPPGSLNRKSIGAGPPRLAVLSTLSAKEAVVGKQLSRHAACDIDRRNQGTMTDTPAKSG